MLGYPQEDAAIVALKAIRNFLEHDHNLVKNFFTFFLHHICVIVIEYSYNFNVNVGQNELGTDS